MKLRYLILFLIIFLTGCNNVEKTVEETELKIVTSFYPVYIFTQNIVKDIPNVTVTNMTNNHVGCLHDYYLSASDRKVIDDAAVLVINGAGLETFMEKIYESNDNIKVIDSSENTELIESVFEDEKNEHIWLSITNAIKQVEKIGDELSKIDVKNSEKYLKNTQEYAEKLKTLRNELRESLYGTESIKIITTHEAFPYFAKDFGIEIIDVIEREEGVSPTPKEMKEIIENITENHATGIFIEPDYSEKLADTIAGEAGVKVYVLDSVTSGDGSLDDYENKMRNNIKSIKDSIGNTVSI